MSSLGACSVISTLPPVCISPLSLSLILSLFLTHTLTHFLSLSLLPRSPSHTTTPARTQSNRWWSAIDEYRMVRGESNGVSPPTEVLHRPQVLAFVLKLTFEVLFTEVLSHTVRSCLSSFSVNQWLSWWHRRLVVKASTTFKKAFDSLKALYHLESSVLSLVCT